VVKYGHPIFRLAADRPRLSRLIAFILGAATTLSFAPYGWSLLAPVLLLPVLYVLLTTAPRDAVWHAFWYSFGLFLTGTYWIYISVHVFGNAALWIALLLMVVLALIMAVVGALGGWLINRVSQGEPWQLLAVAPATWVLVEWVRSWIFTGFPWMALGYGQIDTGLSGWAPVLGVYGVSFMVALTATAVIPAAMALTLRGRLVGGATVVLPWLLGSLLLLVDWTEPEGDKIRATVIQAGLTQDQKWDPQQLRPIMRYFHSETLSVPDSDIVLWPEVAIPALDDNVEQFIDVIETDARRAGQMVLFGVLERSFERSVEGRIYNSMVLVGGEERQVYRKRHLVPFGEYFPVPPSVRQWMKMQNLPHSDLTKGDDRQPLLTMPDGVQFGTAICYEDAFGSEQLYALPAASVLINVSNDAWFGDSIAAYQHLEIARMRSLEFGRPTIRSTNTGITAFIAHDGSLRWTGAQFEPVLMTMDVQPRKGATPYVRVGNWPILGLSFAILGFFWIRNRARL
jgi:apolipoprotein N-acyltransferase